MSLRRQQQGELGSYGRDSLRHHKLLGIALDVARSGVGRSRQEIVVAVNERVRSDEFFRHGGVSLREVSTVVSALLKTAR